MRICACCGKPIGVASVSRVDGDIVYVRCKSSHLLGLIEAACRDLDKSDAAAYAAENDLDA